MGDTGPVSQCYDVLPLRAEPGTQRPSYLPAVAADTNKEPTNEEPTNKEPTREDTADHATRAPATRIGARRRGR